MLLCVVWLPLYVVVCCKCLFVVVCRSLFSYCLLCVVWSSVVVRCRSLSFVVVRCVLPVGVFLCCCCRVLLFAVCLQLSVVVYVLLFVAVRRCCLRFGFLLLFVRSCVLLCDLCVLLFDVVC